MARKDEIFTAFLSHSIFEEKYKLDKEDLPRTLRDGLQSDVPLIKCIALIVENLEGGFTTDHNLKNIVTTYLNKAAI